ncbi:MAG: heat-inducible transcriptional repressor HrcA [Candidatus Anstonellales archaeon]
MVNVELTEREKQILKCIVQNFILTANPVGSRVISKKYQLGLSPASIRNVMADLEEMGLIYHPHTSAGRVPTDLGYRIYVDLLMEEPHLNPQVKRKIDREINPDLVEDEEELLKIASKILGKISSQLALVSYPQIMKATLERIQLVFLPHKILLVVLSLRGGIIKTIDLEFPIEIEQDKIEYIQNLLNERIAGLTLEEIRNTFVDRVADLKDEKTGIVRLFIDSLDKIFSEEREIEKVHISGVKNILQVPEFSDTEHIQAVIELIEDREVILHIFERTSKLDNDKILVSIGKENVVEKLSEFSVVTTKYKFGDANGVIGMIGPRRMDYPKIIAIVSYMSKLLTNILSKKLNE